MDPKEYAARLQRMRDEMETAKARERIQAQSSRELSPETNSGIEAAMAALREDRAGMLRERSAVKKRKEPIRSVDSRPAIAPPRFSPYETDMTRKDLHEYRMKLKKEEEMAAEQAANAAVPARSASPTINATRDTIKPAPAAKPTPAEERVKGLTPAQAESILSDAYSSRGKHGQYTPEEAELMDALRAKAAGFDYGKVKQAPAAYIPSFLGGKK